MTREPDTIRTTVVIPMRNEENFVRACLDSILEQLDEPGETEVLCIDGDGDDCTREIVLAYRSRDARVRLIDNPARIVPVALNLAIREARGDILQPDGRNGRAHPIRIDQQYGSRHLTDPPLYDAGMVEERRPSSQPRTLRGLNRLW